MRFWRWFVCFPFMSIGMQDSDRLRPQSIRVSRRYQKHLPVFSQGHILPDFGADLMMTD
jgi:hypothetical protein